MLMLELDFAVSSHVSVSFCLVGAMNHLYSWPGAAWCYRILESLSTAKASVSLDLCFVARFFVTSPLVFIADTSVFLFSSDYVLLSFFFIEGFATARGSTLRFVCLSVRFAFAQRFGGTIFVINQVLLFPFFCFRPLT